MYCTRDSYPGPVERHISSEAYSSLEKAQEFCRSRGAKEVTPCRFEKEKFRWYEITDMTVV